MRRARLQVKPNIGARKPQANKNDTENSTNEKKSVEEQSIKLESANKLSDKSHHEVYLDDKIPKDPLKKQLNAMDTNECIESTETLVKDLKSQEKTVVADNAVIIEKSKAPTSKGMAPTSNESKDGDNGPSKLCSKPLTATLARRSKVKPMVKLKPRSQPSVALSSTEDTAKRDSSNTAEKKSPEVSKGDRSSDTSSLQVQAASVDQHDHAANAENEKSFTDIKPRAHEDKEGPKIKTDVVPKDLEIEHHDTQLDISGVRVIQMSQEDTLVHDADTTTVSVIKKEKLSQSQNSADNSALSTTPALTTKVVLPKRNRLVKPRPNLLEGSHRKRSASMSASDTDDEFTKKQTSSPSKHVPSTARNMTTPLKQFTTQKNPIQLKPPLGDSEVASLQRGKPGSAEASSKVAESKKWDESLDVKESSIRNGKKKSFFKIQAEKERERRLNMLRSEPRRGPIETLEKPVDRSKTRICDMIYLNPTGNRMKSTIEEEERRKKQLERSESKGTDGEIESSGPLGDTSQQNISRDNVAGIDSTPASDPRPQVVEEEDEPIMVPQVKIGADGQIVINESSLTVAQHNESIVEEDVVEEFGNTAYNPHMYYRRLPKCKPWTWRDTKRFYLALSVVGTDFSLMTNLFQGRSRLDLKKKFKREEKVNRWLVDKALTDTKSYDISLFDQLSETEEEEEKPKVKKEKQTKSTNKEKNVEKEPAKPRIKRTKKAKNLYYECSSEEEIPDKKKKTKTAQNNNQPNVEPCKEKTDHCIGSEINKEHSETKDTSEVTPQNMKDLAKTKKPRRKRKSKEKGNSDRNKTENSEEKGDEVPKGEEDGKPAKKRRKKKENGPSTKRKKKDQESKIPVPPNIGLPNLSPGQLFFVSADGNPQASQGNTGELIHMYVIDTPGDHNVNHTPLAVHPKTPGSDGGLPIVQFPVPPSPTSRPKRVHRDSINDAMTVVDDQEENPFSSFMAQKLLTSQSPRMRTSSATKDINVVKAKREQESTNMLMDLTVLGRRSDVRDLEQDIDLNAHQNIALASSTSCVTAPPESPQIVSVVKLSDSQLPQSPPVKQEKMDKMDNSLSTSHSSHAHNDQLLGIGSPLYAHNFLSNVELMNHPEQGFLQELNSPSTLPMNIPLVPTMTESVLNVSNRTEGTNGAMDLSCKKEPVLHIAEGTHASHISPNTFQDTDKAFEKMFSSPPAANRVVFGDTDERGILNIPITVAPIGSVHQDRSPIVQPMSTAIDTPSIVLMSPDMQRECVIASTASICFVPQNSAVVSSNEMGYTDTPVSASSRQSQYSIPVPIKSPREDLSSTISAENGRSLPVLSTNELSDIRIKGKSVEPNALQHSPAALQKMASRVFINTMNQTGNSVEIKSPTEKTSNMTFKGNSKSTAHDSESRFVLAKQVPQTFSHLSPYHSTHPNPQIGASQLINSVLETSKTPGTYPPILLSPVRMGSVLPQPSSCISKSKISMPNTGESKVSSKVTHTKTKLPSATFKATIKDKQSLKTGSLGKVKSKVLPQVHKFPQTGARTRLPAATFSGSSDDETNQVYGSACVDADEVQDVNQPQPDEWLDATKSQEDSDSDGDGVQTIKIRILKSSERAPEKEKQNSGEINLFVG